MRLTLRTLLAYLDDILDPADKEQLAKKIESSEFAEDLVHRTRDTMRRLRLSAPQVIGSGMGLDPNTVAEYLDNVMPPESVGDFERICLESDMHLAEAAACHHVLTMVLGEPADVDPIARQRMYTMLQEGDARRRLRVEPAHAIGMAAPVAAPMPLAAVASVTAHTPAPTEVPEYLRTSNWSGARIAALALAAVLLITAGVYFLPDLVARFGRGPAQPQIAANDTAGTASGETSLAAPIFTPNVQPEPVVEQSIVDAASPTDTVNSTTAASDRYDFPGSTGTDVATPPESIDLPPADASVAAPTDLASAAGTEPGIVEAATTPPATGEVATTDQIPLPADPIGETTLPTATPADIALPPSTTVAAADLTEPTGIEPAGTGVPVDAAAIEGTASEVAPPQEIVEVPAGPIELGSYLGGKTVLLKFDEAKGGWFRVEPRSAVIEGDHLLSLPEFRPQVSLMSGVNVDISGGTQVVMNAGSADPGADLAAADAQVPLIEVVYGRIILLNTSEAEQPLRIKVDASVAEVRLARNATLGVEVVRQHVPGRDPRKAPAPVVASFFGPHGGIVWLDAAGQKSVEGASRWTVREAVTSEIVADASPPEWLDHEPVGQLSEQRYAAPKIETTLVSNQPADTQLLEMFQTIEQREVKSLVAKCSVHVGLFQPFIEALRDSGQKPNWRTHVETLRSAMAQSPASAESVHRALVEQRGPAAADLFEMLCGYDESQVGRTPEEMKAGSLARLIGWLEQDSLDYRVLAVHDLFEITGKRLMPDPAASVKERAQNVRRWRTRLQDGDLMPTSR